MLAGSEASKRRDTCAQVLKLAVTRWQAIVLAIIPKQACTWSRNQIGHLEDTGRASLNNESSIRRLEDVLSLPPLPVSMALSLKQDSSSALGESGGATWFPG